MKDLVVITGGNSGLGLELARLFAKDMEVLVIARTKKTELKNVIYEYGNVADENFLKALYKKYSNYHIKFLINNAATGWFGSPEENTLDKIQKVIEGGLVGTILNTTYALPLMTQAGGKIINVLSTAALKGNVNESLYCAAKWGARGYTESLKSTYKNTNIKVISVCQGGMNTGFWDENRNYVPKEKSDKWLNPKDVAKIIFDNVTNDKVNVSEIVIERV